MDFSGNINHNQAAADMSSADLFEYLLNAENDSTFASFFPPDSLSTTTPFSTVQQRQQAPSPSYRKISPSMPPSNPRAVTTNIAPIPIAPAPAPSVTAIRPAPYIKPILPKAAPKAAPSTASCIATATAVTTSASTLISPALFTSSGSIPATTIPATEDVWKERFQQLQQLQQSHRHKQHQLLSAAILNSPTTPALTSSTLTPTFTVGLSSSSRAPKSSSPSSSSQRGSSSERSVSPEKADKPRTIYPSPPMNDDMAMESDSEARFGLGSDFTKPTESQLKLMTSKERRQLRNKLSARNFRVRRKEYIDELENQVKEAKQEVADIQRRLIQSELNCQFLRQELEATRLSQSLFGGDGRMTKDHANLLASLLNPNTETFPSTSASTPIAPVAGSIQLSQEQLSSASWMDTTLTNATAATGSTVSADSGTAQATATTTNAGQVPLEPFVPFDGDWSGLLINRAEVSETIVDPKDTAAAAVSSGEAQSSAHELLTRYETLKREEELDAQMRAEIKADTDRRLAQTYMVVPKENGTSEDVRHRLEEESVVLKSLIYMLMVQLTGSLIEAASLSKTDLVRMYQAMDEPLRAKMLAQAKQDCSATNRFSEWREAWIKKCSPSFYNNRRRITELLKSTGICDSCYRDDIYNAENADIIKEMKEQDIIEIARKMEEGVRGLTVEVNGQEIQMCRPNIFYRTFVPKRFKCPSVIAWEKLNAKVAAIAAARAAKGQEQAVGPTSMPMGMPMPTAVGVACA
ncbi:hypothetical protein EC991_003432 [Linnemannia zychae]|nr:hypothetical protein EC991_003432 [Linnemannia zychae]